MYRKRTVAMRKARHGTVAVARLRSSISYRSAHARLCIDSVCFSRSDGMRRGSVRIARFGSKRSVERVRVCGFEALLLQL